ncbi:MAG: hypothetical protein OES26_06520 [Gammaproteobacteria bacterium]|nr:hypothetical protein [Gammaproteobacteria bacterium]
MSKLRGFVAALALLWAGGSVADFDQDLHIESDTDLIQSAPNGPAAAEIQNLFVQGYPVASVLAHYVTMGHTIDDVVYTAIRVDPQRAPHIYRTALDMLPSLPGWACRQADGAEGRYSPILRLDPAQPTASVRDVADAYFRDGRRLPAVAPGQPHLRASVAELSELAGGSDSDYWYSAGNNSSNPNTPLLVSLYRFGKHIVIDRNGNRLQAAQQDGRAEIPIRFLYNDTREPISRVGVQVVDVVRRFVLRGIRPTPVPDWNRGDHHLSADVDELRDLLDIPRSSGIDPQLRAKLETQLRADGFKPPAVLSSLGTGTRVWSDDRARIAVAQSLGITRIPVVFLLHNFERLECGRGAECDELICQAATAAGMTERCDTAAADRMGFVNSGSFGGETTIEQPAGLVEGEPPTIVPGITPVVEPPLPSSPN